jgi:enoyl-CoA hydratase/carnithine racemase
LRQPRLITIAAVQGHAIGAGFQLALACDFRVLADNAMFTMAEVSLGLVPDLAGTKRLVELVGYGRALEICVTGRRVAADEASRIGLANIVVPVDQLDGAVSDLAAAVLAAPHGAVTEIKALIAGAGGRDFLAQEAAERAAQVRRIRDLMGAGE